MDRDRNEEARTRAGIKIELKIRVVREYCDGLDT